MANENKPQDAFSQSPLRAAGAPPSVPAWQPLAVLPMVFALLVLGVCGFLWWQFAPQNGLADPETQNHKPEGGRPPLFVNWAKPDLVLVLTGQMKGYLQPCGCSDPQFGGLSRRYNFIKSLENKGWQVVAVDLGDLAYNKGPHEQSLLKYTTAMRALKMMPYLGVGIGKSEFDLSLRDAVGQLLNPVSPTPPLLSSNLVKFQGVVDPYAVADKSSLKVGVVSMVTKSLRDHLEKSQITDAKFDPNVRGVFEKALQNLGQKQVELGVLLVQGKEFDHLKDKKDAALDEAKNCANLAAELRQQNPALAPLSVILHVTDQAEPPGKPQMVGQTALITLGHKGKYVGVLGVYRNKSSFDFKYELVPMGPEYDSPKNNNPVADLMEEYAKEVKDKDYLEKFGRSAHPIQVYQNGKYKDAFFVGSDKCQKCHPGAFQIWETPVNPQGVPHGHAFAHQTLSRATRPSLRQHDGECIVCHTVGFETKTGFYDKSFAQAFALNDPKRAPTRELELRKVGCESCHGPASEHIKNKNNKEILALMNPFKASVQELNPQTPPAIRTTLHSRRMLKIGDFCQKCHDTENDVHWDFKKAWPKVVHMNNQGNANGPAAPVIQAPPQGGGLVIEPLKNDGKQK